MLDKKVEKADYRLVNSDLKPLTKPLPRCESLFPV
jgi:hypothetical protein